MFHEILRVLERTGVMSPQGSRKTLNGSWNINTCKKTQRNKKFLKFFFFLFLFDCVYVSWDPEGARENRVYNPARFSNSPWVNHQKQKLYIFFGISSQTLCFLRLYGSQTFLRLLRPFLRLLRPFLRLLRPFCAFSDSTVHRLCAFL
jgi:hypothetical protein